MATRTVLDEQAFIYDWEGGMTTAAMGAKYGVCDSTVSKIAARMGLAGRRSEEALARPTTHDGYALTGGTWVAAGGIMRWIRG